MTRTLFLITLMLVLGLALTAAAQDVDGIGNGNGICQFIDEDGDGFNDLAPDADGDGIPNGLDPDYVRPEDCEGDGNADQGGNQGGAMARRGQLGGGESLLKADGVAAAGQGQGGGHGPGDGTGGGLAPGDCTGFGPGDGTGECDGSGSLAEVIKQRRGGRR